MATGHGGGDGAERRADGFGKTASGVPRRKRGQCSTPGRPDPVERDATPEVISLQQNLLITGGRNRGLARWPYDKKAVRPLGLTACFV